MQLVAYNTNGDLFRAQSVVESDIERDKERMKSDTVEELTFQVMSDDEFDQYLESLPKPIIPDPDEELAEAITNATTLPELKAALLGNGTLARVKGRAK